MEKQMKLMVAIFSAAALLTSCGSSKTAAPGGTEKGTKNTVWGLDIQLNECQVLAEKKPVTRAFGEGLSTRLSYAKTYAEGQARAALARTIAPIIKSAAEDSGLDFTKASSSDMDGASVTDEGSKRNNITLQIADAVVANSVVIKVNQYLQPNRQYHVFVCVEYMGGTSDMAKKIARGVTQRISDEDRMKMNYDMSKFEEKVEKELKKRDVDE